jgi:quinolinate synthase
MNFKSEIEKLKKEKNALILAHYYVNDEVQEIADIIGDSLALAEASLKVQSDIIVFCGVHFMAETAKILNHKAKVLLPDLNAGCSLADATPIDEFIRFKEQHPEAVVVSYINCSAAVKAESDYICTSSNAVDVVKAIPSEKEIIFAPDKHLGAFVEKMTNRKMHLWDGSCIVHLNISLEKLKMLIQQHPDAILIAHPECAASILDLAAFVGSTKSLIDYVKSSSEKKFIVATEAGILYKMRQEAPDKIVIPAPSFETNTCACSECPYMKLNTLEKVYHTLKNETPAIEVENHISERALQALNKMLSVPR